MDSHLIINNNSTIRQSLIKLKNNGQKCLIVIDSKKKVVGTLTDGDIRKKLLINKKIDDSIKNIFRKKFKFFYKDNFSKNKIKSLIFKKQITLIPILDKEKKLYKIISAKNFSKKKKKNTFISLNCPVVIMAGGEGKRLEPLTKVFPKALMPIRDKTVLDKIIESFSKYGLKRYFFILNHKAEMIKAYFKKNKNYTYIIEKKPLGTIGGVKLIKNKFTNFFLTNCDIILKTDYSKIYKFHKKLNNDLTIIISKKKYQIPYGVCKVHKDVLKSFIEKPTINFFTSVGVYIIKKKVLKLIDNNKRVDFNELIKISKQKNLKIGTYKVNESNWQDIGQLKEYKEHVKKIYG